MRYQCAMADGSKVMTRNTAKLKSDTESPSLQSIDDKLNSIIGILEKNSCDINDIKKEQKEMCTSIELCHASVSDIKQIISGHDSKIIKCEEEILHLKNEKQKMSAQIVRMEEKLRDLEQYSHKNSLIIYGVPEDKGENIYHVMRRLAGALHFPDWSSGLVDAVHRMGKSTGSTPRPIIVKFVRRQDKEEFLTKRKVRRNLKATDLGFSGDTPVYINESLTPANRELMKGTREAAKRNGYAHVWTANGSIFVRREKGSPALKISSVRDLDRM